jgi:Fic family protein
MKPINYQITNVLVNNLIELEISKAQIQAIEPGPDIEKNLEYDRETLEIFHTANLLGIQLTIKDAEKFKHSSYNFGSESNQKILQNFKNVLDFLRSNKDNNIAEINSNFALHINKILISNWKEAWEAKFKSDDKIDEGYDDWAKYRDTTINPLESQNEFNNSIKWFKENEGRINTVLRLGVLIYRLIRVSPFMNLNKLTILSIANFALLKDRYLDKSLMSIVGLFEKNSKTYHEILTASVDSPTGNISYWLERFTKDFGNELKLNKVEVQRIIKENKGGLKQPFLNLNKRQLKVLRYLQTIPSIKREDYVQMFEVSTMTAFRDLKELFDKKLIKSEGKGRATQYVLANR